VGSAGAYQTNGFSTPLPMTGAFYRIHTIHTLAPASDAGTPDGGAAATTCQFPDMTDQIGCLVSVASPCSIGYAGRGSLTTNAKAAGIKINKQNPIPFCVQAQFLYPFSRKLYLNTIPGFAAVTGQEQALAACETDLPQPADGGTSSGLLTNI